MANDEDALSKDGGYNSDQSKDQSEDTKSKIMYPGDNDNERADNIYFYYTTGDSSILCMMRLMDIEHMYTIRKHY